MNVPARSGGPGTAIVLDATALRVLDRLPTSVDRVVLTFQVSPARRADLSRRFEGASIVDAVPARPGPWHALVDRDLEELAEIHRTEGVPVFDCFRAVMRDELSALRSLETALRGVGRVHATRGGASEPVLESVAARGGFDAVEWVDAPPAPTLRRAGLLGKARTAGARGIALAVSSRLDPSYALRALLSRRPRLEPAKTLMVSSYVNPTRAALEALEALGGGPAVLLCAGPGAADGLSLPNDVRSVGLAAALSLDRARARAIREEVVAAILDRLARWDPPDDPWARWPAIARTDFGRRIAAVHLPELLSTLVAVQSLVRAIGAERLVVGDEFAFSDRVALHAAHAMGLDTVSRQHGILDGHLVRDVILARRYLAWDRESSEWLRETGASARTEVAVLPRTVSKPAATPDARRTVVVFVQPTDLVRVPLEDWLAETLPSVLRAADRLGLRVVMKPHPLQNRAAVLDLVPAAARAAVTVVSDASARALLGDAAIAVVLDSSVAADARDMGVPCVSTAWYAGNYVSELVRLGYVVPCESPEALESAICARAGLSA